MVWADDDVLGIEVAVSGATGALRPLGTAKGCPLGVASLSVITSDVGFCYCDGSLFAGVDDAAATPSFD